MKRTVIFFALALCVGLTGTHAQGLNAREVGQITDQTEYLIREYELLLNTITHPESRPSDVKLMIENAYAPENSQRFFWNDKVVVEDDINPERAQAGRAADLTVDRYLKDLDLLYLKSADPSVSFQNVDVSAVKHSDYYYVKVYFDRIFRSKHKHIARAYEPVRRVAEVRLEVLNGEWTPYLVGLRYFVKQDSIDDTKNDVAIQMTEEVGAEVASTIKSQNEIYQNHLLQGRKALESEDYEAAKAAFEQALALRPNATHPLRELQELKKKDWYAYHFRRAMQARQARDYEAAVSFFKKAREEKLMDAQARGELDKAIEELSGLIRRRDLYYSRADADKHDDIIKEFANALKSAPSNAFVDAETYLFLGKCYVAKGNHEEALKAYNQAIKLDSYYTQALAARASLYYYLTFSETNAGKKQDLLRQSHADYSVIISNHPTAPEYYKERAAIRVHLQEWKGAQEDYQQAIILDPKNAARHFDLALFSLEHQKDSVQAYSSLNAAIQQDSTYGQAYFKRGMLEHHHFKEIGKAAEDFTKALAYGLSDTDKRSIQELSRSYYTEGNRLFQASDQKAAILAYDKALLLYPALADAHFMRGEALMWQNEFHKAISSYSQALQHNDALHLAIFRRGQAYHSLGDFEQAISDFEQVAVQNATPNALFFNNSIAMYRSYQRLGEHQKVIALCEGTIKQLNKYNSKIPAKASGMANSFVSTIAFDKMKTLSDLYTIAGKSKYELDQTKEAIKDFDRAIKVDKKNSAPYYARGVAYYNSGNHKKAVANFTANLTYGDKRPNDYLVRGQAYQMRGKHMEAIKDYQTVTNLDSTMTIAHYFRGISLAKMGAYDEALLYYSMYLAEDAKSNYYAERGTIKTKLGLYAEAKEDYVKALELEPANPEALYGMACLTIMDNRFEEALPSLREAFQSRRISKNRVKQDSSSLLTSVAGKKEFKELVKNIDKKSEGVKSYSVLLD